jgi:hypothetical protein
VHEVDLVVYNNRKPMILCDIFCIVEGHLFARYFLGLKQCFYLPENHKNGAYQGIMSVCSSNEIAQRDISNGVNHSSNEVFMRKLRVKQWRVNFKTQLTSEGHNFLFWNQIEA